MTVGSLDRGRMVATSTGPVTRSNPCGADWDEVASLVVYLLSPAADYITGTTVVIDGALSLTVAQGA